jgi:CDP-diacylglycerol--serine O-phosphatidyltransferase
MVSNFRYNSFKEVDWKGKVNFFVVLLIVLTFVIVAASPAELLTAIFVLYASSGPFTTIRSVKKLKLEHVVGDDQDADFNKESENTNPEIDNASTANNRYHSNNTNLETYIL